MKTYFHPKQKLHHPRTYLSRGQMRTPQEIPERVVQILKGIAALGLTVTEPEDHGMQPLLAIHDAGYLQYLETAHAIWKQTGPDWGDEVISNIFVRSPNAMRGILGQTARYLADGSCPVGPDTYTSSYWAAQAAVSAAKAVLAGDQQAYALCRPPDITPVKMPQVVFVISTMRQLLRRYCAQSINAL